MMRPEYSKKIIATILVSGGPKTMQGLGSWTLDDLNQALCITVCQQLQRVFEINASSLSKVYLIMTGS